MAYTLDRDPTRERFSRVSPRPEDKYATDSEVKTEDAADPMGHRGGTTTSTTTAVRSDPTRSPRST